MIWRCS